LDGETWTLEELRSNLRDIRRVNRLGGGTSAVMRELPSLFHDISPERTVEVLDVATGSADIPLAIAKWANRNRRQIRLIVSDWSEDVLTIAKEEVGDRVGFQFSRLDAREVQLPDQSVDIVLCSLALHHFDPANAVRVLAEMKRISRVGCLVNDLVRSRSGHLAAIMIAKLLTQNRLTRHDAPLSVLRAYTDEELRSLLVEAGWEGALVQRRPLFRMTAVWRRPQ